MRQGIDEDHHASSTVYLQDAGSLEKGRHRPVQTREHIISGEGKRNNPVYNCERFIRDAVESALAQTHPCHEVIVVDDGSTDGTAEILRGYADSGRIKYYYQENKGNASARNTGLRHATGDYVAFLDSDDFWHDEKTERQLAFLRAHAEASLVFCDEFSMSMGGEPVKTPPKAKAGEDLFEKLLDVCYTTISSVMLRREVIEKTGTFNEKLQYNVDYEFLLRALTRFRMAYLPEYLLTRRAHEGSLTSKYPYTGYQFMDVYLSLKGMLDRRQARTLKKRNIRRCWKSAAWLVDRGLFKAGTVVFLETVRRYPPFISKLPAFIKKVAVAGARGPIKHAGCGKPTAYKPPYR